jgi:hypothetical protein
MQYFRRFLHRRNAKPGAIALSLMTFLFLTGLYAVIVPLKAEAAGLSSIQDTLSTSAPATLANHTIQFITATGVESSTDTITLTFDTSPGFTMGTFALLNFDLAVSAAGSCASFTDKTLAASAASGVWGVGQSSNVVTFTAPTNATTGEITAGRCVQIEIGANATNGGAGALQITNPTKVAAAGTADIETIDIGGLFGDTGTALTATVEGVSVSVTVTESMSFSIALVNSGSCTGDSGSPTAVTTTATTVPFGSIASSNAFYVGCHTLSVSTNGSGGYVVTTEENRSLKSTAGDYINDSVCDSTCSESTGTAWATATNNGFAYSCVGTHCATNSVTTYKQFACTGADADCNPGTGAETIQTLASYNDPVSADTAVVHYKLSISGTQAAGTYTNTITYVATPAF